MEFEIEDFDQIIEIYCRDELDLPHLAIDSLLSLMQFVFKNYPKDYVKDPVDIARLHLLVRVYNDLKSIDDLSIKGYSVQAATIACALYEAALMTIFLDKDERAQKWLTHERSEQGMVGVSKLKSYAIVKMKWPMEHLKEISKVYTYLSMAKHSNPLILKVHSAVKDENSNIAEYAFHYGPESSSASIRLSWYAVIMSIQLGNAALSIYINDLEPYMNDEVCDRIRKLHGEFLNICDEVVLVSAEKFKD